RGGSDPAGRADDGRAEVIASGCNTTATERCADPSPETDRRDPLRTSTNRPRLSSGSMTRLPLPLSPLARHRIPRSPALVLRLPRRPEGGEHEGSRVMVLVGRCPFRL